MTRSRITTTIGIGLIVILVALGWLVRRNTSFFPWWPSTTNITKNNINPSVNINAAVDLTTLHAVTLDVPAAYRTGVLATTRTLNVPQGWHASLYATGLAAARGLFVTDEGMMFVADKGAGQVVLLTMSKHDQGQLDQKIVVDSNLRNVHSVFYFEGDLFVGEENQIDVYRHIQADGHYAKKEVIVPNLPTTGHGTRTVIVGPDRKLYVSIGSSCNVCEESDPRRAAVMQYNLDGSGGHLFASGLRNSVGITFHGQELWGVDNGRDLLGDNLPPEEVNIIRDGKNYGWPYCYADRVTDAKFKNRVDLCPKTEPPIFQMQAHSAPLGLAFGPTNSLPGIDGKLAITFHGSWNRSEWTGYKIVWVDPTQPGSATTNLVTGWLTTDGQVWGRPVGILFSGPAMYISDDQVGAIYRFTAGS